MTGIPDAVATVRATLSSVAEAPSWSLFGDELAGCLRHVSEAAAMLAGLELRLSHQATSTGLGGEVGAADTRAWWAGVTRQDVRAATRRLAVASAMETRWHVLATGVARGEVSEVQATVITAALDALPDRVETEVVGRAEKELVRLAEHHDPKALRILGRRVLDVVAPEVAEDHERRLLEAEEDEAAAACRFTMSEDGHGRWHGRFTLPSLAGAALRKAVLAYAAPRHRAAGNAPRLDKPGPHRLGEAFAELVSRLPGQVLPRAGGLAASVVVTMTLDQLLARCEGVATLDTGEPITAGQARLLACEARVVPVVLGGRSEPLDVGRARRFHTPAQRLAVALRDHTCTALGCDYPPAMCHVHHDHPWSEGGHTTVHEARLLCPRHHTMAHDPRSTMRQVKNGRVVFART